MKVPVLLIVFLVTFYIEIGTCFNNFGITFPTRCKIKLPTEHVKTKSIESNRLDADKFSGVSSLFTPSIACIKRYVMVISFLSLK